MHPRLTNNRYLISDVLPCVSANLPQTVSSMSAAAFGWYCELRFEPWVLPCILPCGSQYIISGIGVQPAGAYGIVRRGGEVTIRESACVSTGAQFALVAHCGAVLCWARGR